jgi:hypothetical protein
MLLKKRVELGGGRHGESAAAPCDHIGRGRGRPQYRRLERLAAQQCADQVTEKCIAGSERLLDVDDKDAGFERPVGGNRDRSGGAFLEYCESTALADETGRSRKRVRRASPAITANSSSLPTTASQRLAACA